MRNKRIGAIFVCGLLSLFVYTPTVFAEDFRSPEVRVFELTKKARQERQQNNFLFAETTNENGGTVAVGDVNGDGRQEIIVGSGPGSAPRVSIYNNEGVQLSSFAPYPESMIAGVTVASGDLDNNGNDDIVVGTMRGGGPQVRVFDMNGAVQFTNGFMAYDASFRGGVNVAVANVNGKGGAEIVTGSGSGGGAHVRVFNRSGSFTGLEYYPFGANDKGGVSVAAANVDGGTEDEIVMGIHSFGESWVKVYKTDSTRTIVGNFRAYDASYRGGVMLSSADVDKDGVDEIVTTTRQSGGPHVRFFEGHGKLVSNGFMAYESDFRGGVAIAAGQVDNDSKVELVSVPQKKVVEGRLDVFKYIDVDLSEQTLRAYRNGVKEKEFLVSTGIARYPTPEGDFFVMAKIPIKDYEWSYGDDNPDNYDIKDVHNNLRFLPHFYLHEAYWHNNFGTPMSHGCVNINLVNSAWLYQWANVGDPVYVHQ